MVATKQVKQVRKARRAQAKEPEAGPRSIVLVGFMGCGKSTVGKGLAKLTGRAYVDLDREIERGAGRAIRQIFLTSGELGFRALESRALGHVLKTPCVLATGGGLVLLAENRKRLSGSGACVVWLDPSWNSLWKRLKSKRTGARPLLFDQNAGRPRSERSIRKLWRDRRNSYAAVATIRVRVKDGEVSPATLRRLAQILGF